MNIATISSVAGLIVIATSGTIYIEKDKATKLEVAESARDIRIEAYEQQIESHYERIDDIEARSKSGSSYSTDEQKKKDAERALERLKKKRDQLK